MITYYILNLRIDRGDIIYHLFCKPNNSVKCFYLLLHFGILWHIVH